MADLLRGNVLRFVWTRNRKITVENGSAGKA